MHGMAFPQTRHTLIQRIARGPTEDGWREFLADYWGPVVGFARRWGRLSAADAEDVASTTFEALVENDLLERWSRDRRSKLRTLLCRVVRNEIANRTRKVERRQRLVDEHGGALDDYGDTAPSDEQLDVFYASWAEHVLRATVDELMNEYFARGRGDYFRVLYGRICEGMSNREVAEGLGIPVTDVENRYRHARDRLRALLETRVRTLTARYAATEDGPTEFEGEWRQLGEWLATHGGLEQAVRIAAGGDSDDPQP